MSELGMTTFFVSHLCLITYFDVHNCLQQKIGQLLSQCHGQFHEYRLVKESSSLTFLLWNVPAASSVNYLNDFSNHCKFLKTCPGNWRFEINCLAWCRQTAVSLNLNGKLK